MRVGRDLLPIADVLGTPQPVVVNGATFFVGGRYVDSTVKEVLDRYDSYCQRYSGGFEDEFAKVPPKKLAALPPAIRDPKRFGVMRNEIEDEGVLACLAQPEESKGFRGLVERVQRFSETGDLSSIGHLRYVYARKSRTKPGTHLISVWIDGPINARDMLLSEGDAPGRDSDEIPRPKDSKRVITAEAKGTPYSMRCYETKELPESILAFYDEVLPSLGWKEIPPSKEADAELVRKTTRSFTKKGAVSYVIAAHDQGGTYVQIVEMGTRGTVTTEQGAAPTLAPPPAEVKQEPLHD
jgi:hypothetical protein